MQEVVMQRKGMSVALVAVMLLVLPNGSMAQNARPCSLEGSWLQKYAEPPGMEPLLFVESLALLDPAGQQLGYRGTAPNPLRWTPFAPDVDVAGDAVGIFVRTGPRTYRYTITAQGAEAPPKGTPARGQIQVFWVHSGVATCVDDNTVEYEGTWAIFSAIDVPAMGISNQDRDRDGFPDAGERPIVVVPSHLLSKRVQLREPYPLVP